MASNSANISKLQKAINFHGGRILYNTTQFYSADQDRTITLHIIKKAVWDEDKNKFVNIELFASASQIQIVLFLRDYWFEMNGLELPTDNEMWNKIRERINGQDDKT